MEPWCRNAYMDVALNSRCFHESAWHVSWVNAKFMTAVNILNGATWLFQLAGLGAITSLGHLQTCVIIKYYPGFEDPYSPDYVQNPFLLSICGSVVAFTMAFPFMMIFDTVSDTVLFAYIVQKMREEKEKVPTVYSRACGFIERVDDFIGLGCVEHDHTERVCTKHFRHVEPRPGRKANQPCLFVFCCSSLLLRRIAWGSSTMLRALVLTLSWGPSAWGPQDYSMPKFLLSEFDEEAVEVGLVDPTKKLDGFRTFFGLFVKFVTLFLGCTC